MRKRALVTGITGQDGSYLAAQSHVAVSFEEPGYTANTDGIGVLRVLEAVRIAGLANTARIYQASTSELFGKPMGCMR